MDSVCGRVRCARLRDRCMTAEEAARLVPQGAVLGVSGFARAGSPKAVPRALARLALGGRAATARATVGEAATAEAAVGEAAIARAPIGQAPVGGPSAEAGEGGRTATGRSLQLSVWSGGSVGGEIDEELAATGAIVRRLPYQSLGAMRRLINEGRVAYVDMHLGACPELARAGQLGKVDVALLEVCAVREDGSLVPTSSVGNSALYAAMADRIIVEVNLWHPPQMEGLHDIWTYSRPPGRTPLPLLEPLQRIGAPAITVDPDRIAAIVETSHPDHPYTFEVPDDDARRIGAHLLDFLRQEVRAGRLPPTPLPLQTGIGNLGNAVLNALAEWDRPGLVFFSEVLQDGVLDLIDAGMARGASGTSLALSAHGQQRLQRELDRYRRHLVLRPQEVSNSGEAIRRLGVIAINTAVEGDIYGHVNSTHVLGSQLLNGIGGSGDFSRNALLSIFITPSTARDGRISCVVPVVSHVDHTEHEVHVLISEQGVADLRGLSPRERAGAIISRCAHPSYRPLLEDYFVRACRQGGHSPHLLAEAFSWQLRYQHTGAMLPAGIPARGAARR